MAWVPQLLVLKDGEVIDNVLLHGKETFIVGRHQNCDVVAGHASISRHHLEIRVIQDSRELLLTDLHSVHGTKINEKVVAAMEPVSMKEGDKFSLGASTRFYIVKWQPVPDECSDSSSSSCTPSKSGASALLKGFEEEFQSSLKLNEDKENRSPEAQPKKRAPFSECNGRSSPRNSMQKKPPPSPVRKSPASISSAVLRMSPAGKKIFGDRADKSPSKLWLRRCTSNPLPILVTGVEAPSAPPAPKLVSYEDSPDDHLSKLKVDEESYFSDKENVAPVVKPPDVVKPAEKTREPFRQLFFLPPSPSPAQEYKPVFEPVAYSSSDEDSLEVPKQWRQQTTTRNSNSLLAGNAENIWRRRKESVDQQKQWQMVVDTNCFLDEASFKALKQLEGIRETRLIIPKIVIRELDFLKRNAAKGHLTRRALRWIEDCMVNKPWWIHVQSNNEIRGVNPTPPISPMTTVAPELFPFTTPMDLLSPTNDDHVLDCALLFARRSSSPTRVVLLTGDTALKIKAMAEGLVAERSSEFCSSLLDPYSERFLWAGSTAHGSTWSARGGSSPLTSPLSRSSCGSGVMSSSNNIIIINNNNNKMMNLKMQENARGLQVVL